jgi:hypothetical protein
MPSYTAAPRRPFGPRVGVLGDGLSPSLNPVGQRLGAMSLQYFPHSLVGAFVQRGGTSRHLVIVVAPVRKIGKPIL